MQIICTHEAGGTNGKNPEKNNKPAIAGTQNRFPDRMEPEGKFV